MPNLLRKIRLPAACIACSALVHLLPVVVLQLCATFHFGGPVNAAPAVMVDLADRQAIPADPVPAQADLSPPAASDATSSAPHPPETREKVSAGAPPEGAPAASSAPAVSASSPSAAVPPSADPSQASPEPAAPPMTAAKTPKVSAAADARATLPATAPATAAAPGIPPEAAASQSSQQHGPRQAAALRLRSNAFLTVQHEKLSYLISMHGIPIGNAELEATNELGVISITLRVRSNAAISQVFPVDDVVETRHVDGQFIMAKIRQQEGSFRSDQMFTINLGKKRVSFVDFLQNRNLKTSVPSDEVLDTLSAIYYLRNRQLQVGRTETLHIYDSEIYAEVPVEVLRRDQLRLANLSRVATLVVRPLQKTAGIFRRTGDVLIWMTDDEHRVPVRIVTSVALGEVTAELISAESSPLENGRNLPASPVVSRLSGPVSD
jgi:hypothetical protein